MSFGFSIPSVIQMELFPSVLSVCLPSYMSNSYLKELENINKKEKNKVTCSPITHRQHLESLSVPFSKHIGTRSFAWMPSGGTAIGSVNLFSSPYSKSKTSFYFIKHLSALFLLTVNCFKQTEAYIKQPYTDSPARESGRNGQARGRPLGR